MTVRIYVDAESLQEGAYIWIDGGGTADAITATYSPALTTLVDGQICLVRATAANTTTTPTFSPNGLTAHTIVKNGGNALVVGDIAGDGHELILQYDLTNTRWELLNPAIATVAGALDVATSLTISAADRTFIGLPGKSYTGLTLVPVTAGLRTEFHIRANDGLNGAVRDQDCGAETVWDAEGLYLDSDGNFVEPDNNVIFAFRSNRSSGVTNYWTWQQQTVGTGTLLPLKFDPAGGDPSFVLSPDRTSWFGAQVTFGGSGSSTAATISLGTSTDPVDTPSVDFFDSNSPASSYRLRNISKEFSIVQQDSGSVYFKLNASGEPYFPHVTSQSAASLSPNLRYDSSTGLVTYLAGTPTSYEAATTANGAETSFKITSKNSDSTDNNWVIGSNITADSRLQVSSNATVVFGINNDGSLLPGSGTPDIGSASFKYGTVYATNLNASNINLGSIPVYANNAAAISGGLSAGDVYRTGADPDPLCIVH
jgi:hypothetical protein